MESVLRTHPRAALSRQAAHAGALAGRYMVACFYSPVQSDFYSFSTFVALLGHPMLWWMIPKKQDLGTQALVLSTTSGAPQALSSKLWKPTPTGHTSAACGAIHPPVYWYEEQPLPEWESWQHYRASLRNAVSEYWQKGCDVTLLRKKKVASGGLAKESTEVFGRHITGEYTSIWEKASQTSTAGVHYSRGPEWIKVI